MLEMSSALSETVEEFAINVRSTSHVGGEWGNENCFYPLCKLFNVKMIVLDSENFSAQHYVESTSRAIVLAHRGDHHLGYLSREAISTHSINKLKGFNFVNPLHVKIETEAEEVSLAQAEVRQAFALAQSENFGAAFNFGIHSVSRMLISEEENSRRRCLQIEKDRA